jgi:hypothetical protein
MIGPLALGTVGKREKLREKKVLKLGQTCQET